MIQDNGVKFKADTAAAAAEPAAMGTTFVGNADSLQEGFASEGVLQQNNDFPKLSGIFILTLAAQ